MATRRPLSKRKRIGIIVLAVLVVMVTAVGLFAKFKPEKGEQVILSEVGTANVTETIDMSGTVESENKMSYEIVNGVKAAKVYVAEGDKVHKGDVLATFDMSSLSAVLSKKQSDYNKAVKAYNASASSSSDAAKNLTNIEKEIAALEKQIASAEKKKNETTTAPEANKATTSASASWLDNLDYSALKKIFGSSYTEAEIKEMLQKLVSFGGTKSQLQKFIESIEAMADMQGSMDYSSIMQNSMGGAADLLTMQTQLVSLKAQKSLLEAQSKNVMGDTYKTLVETAKTNLDEFKAVYNTLAKGWIADGDGIVSKVNVETGKVFSSVSDIKDLDVSAVISALSGGGDAGALLQTLGVAGNGVGMVVEYYDQFTATVVLSKSDILKVSVGQEVDVTSLGSHYEGEVIYISPTANSSSSGLNIGSIASGLTGGTSNGVEAKVLIKHPDEKVIIGLDVDISIIVGSQENAVVVPVEAVQYDNDGNQYVYIYDEKSKTVNKSQIDVGISEDTQYQILSGCAKGDKIVRNPSAALTDGAKVRVIEDKK